MSESAECSKCGLGWPKVTFQSAVATSDMTGPLVCDTCRVPLRESQIAEKIDEAQLIVKTMCVREVRVCGIESGTNITEFHFWTHEGIKPLILTTLFVVFKGNALYTYFNVPVAVCEAWYAAPSKGGYFIQFIKTAYECEKVT